MRKVAYKELTAEDFRPYGAFARMLDPVGVRIGEPPMEFFRDLLAVNLGHTCLASFSTCRVTRRKAIVDTLEFHSRTGEAILPLDGDILMQVGPATPNGEIPHDRVVVFRVPRGTMLALNPGVWHHAAFPLDRDQVNILVVLPERTYANDCAVFVLPPENRTEVAE